MKKYIAFGAIAIVLIAGVVHFSRTSSPPPDPRLIDADNDFAFRLYKEIAKTDGNKNIFISPVSIALALQMTYNGASGTVKEEMAETLGVEDMRLNELNLANARLASMLEHPGRGIELSIAHSIWTDKGVKPDFRRVVGPSYNVEFGPLKANAMNTWVDQQTKGRIKRIVERLDSNDSVVLLDAAYFEADWASRFDRKATKFLPFHTESGRTDEVPTMGQRHEFACMKDDGCSGIRLPYAGSTVSMYIFLPDGSLKALVEKLSIGNWYNWMAAFGQPQEVGVYLPRFNVDYAGDLTDELTALGMREAFEGEDFVNMIEGGGAWIGTFNHKAVVEVNEEGTKAAAATEAVMELGYDFTYFTVDRPFFFVIRDDKTGLILFMGSVVDPARN